ncbi:lysostaphin resistance A-like protein [Nocardioides sp.]|uniref:CPBP family intramembrane glutamic endopeptidase n=1 Tax=Nocardioides sp. TaxID=35761 RepID=UPI0035197D5C
MRSTDASPTLAPVGTRAEPYHRLGTLGLPGAWRPVVGIGLLVLLILSAQVVCGVVVSAALALSGRSSAEITDALSGDPTTPSFLALVNLGWALAIAAAILVVRLVHGQGAGRLASVVGRLRWRWFAVCLALAALSLVLTLVVGSFLPDQGAAGTRVDGGLNPWTTATRDFLLVILLLTPLQAAGEEYVFRGYLTQALGQLAAGRVGAIVAVTVPALLFALAHGAQDLPVFADRLAFGLVAGVLVLRTGGLEAGIAMHVLNNFLAFGLALAFGDMTSALQPGDGTWWALPVTLTQSVSFVVLATWAARRRGIEVRGGGPGLVARRGRV